MGSGGMPFCFGLRRESPGHRSAGCKTVWGSKMCIILQLCDNVVNAVILGLGASVGVEFLFFIFFYLHYLMKGASYCWYEVS